jgi:hypothetical protein
MEYEYDYQVSPVSPAEVMLIMLGVCAALALIWGFMWWGVLKKGGYAGWLSMLPVANVYFLVKISGKPGYWALLFFVPFVNVIILIWTWNMISKSFGKDEGFTIGLVLLPIIFFPILGYGDARWLGPYGNRELFEAMQGKTKFEFEEQSTA